MPWWNPWKRTLKQWRHESLTPGLKLATGHADVFCASMSSDDLARQLLDEASEKVKDSPADTEVTVQVSGEHLDVHHMELMMSCMTLGFQYGLRIQVQYDNSVTFVKL